ARYLWKRGCGWWSGSRRHAFKLASGSMSMSRRGGKMSDFSSRGTRLQGRNPVKETGTLVRRSPNSNIGAHSDSYPDVTIVTRWAMWRAGPKNAATFFGGRAKQSKVKEGHSLVWKTGYVEGREVKDIVLDTGAARTLVRDDLVPRNKFLKKCVAVQCVHGDEVSYPLAKVEVVVDGKSYLVEAAVVKKLPKSVLLARDVPELVRIGNPEEALAAMTRAQAKRKREEEESELEKEKDSGVNCRSLTPVPETVKEKLLPGPVGPEDDGLERSTVIEPGQSEDTNPPKDGAVEIIVNDGDLGVDEKDLRELQLEDETLGAVRESAKQPSNVGNYWFYEEDGLLYRHWHPREEGEELAHEIPLAGHLGKKKTVERILQRFYWPTLYRDVAEWCRTCEQCQKHSAVNLRAPLVPLPVIEEPFTRIAMNIVGPLPRSSTGNKYILVVCDYATRYPEAIPMRTVDAEHVAEELVTMFARVGVPREILTDQGTNFMSKLLAELYNLLHIHPATTGFSPFELMYGRHVRGPLDILKETWKASKRSGESVISYVLTVQQKLAMMSELVSENCKEAQMTQKRWYDQSARKREFMEGDQVLVLLPTVTNKLMAKWQGPYCVKAKVTPVTYEIDMSDKKKRQRIFHVNMLKG
ncbi:hypothetical protein EMCRGX_G005901, partial [Ephydatia muelleri]